MRTNKLPAIVSVLVGMALQSEKPQNSTLSSAHLLVLSALKGLSHLIFGATEQLSSTLQYKDINAQEVSTAVSAAVAFLQRQRCDSAFDRFYDATVVEAQAYTQEPTLPRPRKVPKKLNDGAPGHHHVSEKDHFRQQYYEVLDVVMSEMKRRFDQPTLTILHEIEKLIIDSSNGAMIEPSATFKDMYAADLNIVTIPLTSATAERTFSTLRRLKSYLRSTMTQKRLNHLVLLHTYHQRTDDLNLVAIA